MTDDDDDPERYRREAELAFRAAYIADELNQARGADVAYHVSHALRSLHSGKATRITGAKAEGILRAIDEAQPHVLELFSDKHARAFALHALNEARGLTRAWAEDPALAHVRDRAEICNSHRYVRWLRNECHNFVLLDDIEEFHSSRARDARLTRQAAWMPLMVPDQ